MAKQLTDDELNLRRRARRRLVGAIALTLAVVVILPMVLDSEPKPEVQDIELRIPNPDKASEFVPGVSVPETPAILPAAPAVEVAASAPATVAETAKPAAAETYAVQVGAYSNPDTAKQELKKLKDWGFKAYTEKAGDKVRVRVGPYAEREKADKARLMLEKHGLHPDIVTVK